MVFDKQQYELLDFGEGRKLERFANEVVDRPCAAAASGRRAQPHLWSRASCCFERSESGGKWHADAPPTTAWQVRHERAVFELATSPFGHLGIFPEQAANWDWIATRIHAAQRPLNVINLFGYTGGSTLAAAAAGASVTHVDAARNTVTRARRNATLSGLGEYPIRWLVEDAIRFCRREVRRGRKYDGLILDPPTYGHGPKNERWEIDRHLEPLLALCRQLFSDEGRFALLTSHTERLGERLLGELIAPWCGPTSGGSLETGEMFLAASDGRRLTSGRFARWKAEETLD